MEREYRERPPPARLRGVLACTWTRVSPPAIAEVRVVPDACVDVVWRDDGLLQVAGPDTGPVRVTMVGCGYVGARFLPGVAPSLLGVPASALRDLRVDLYDLWGRSCADRLADALAGAGAQERAEELLAGVIEKRLSLASPPDPVVRALIARFARGRSRLAAAAADLGVSERQLRRRCETAVGYGPKTLERILRFQRFRALARRGAGSLAELALEAGYADQAHLNREHLRLAGVTPRTGLG